MAAMHTGDATSPNDLAGDGGADPSATNHWKVSEDSEHERQEHHRIIAELSLDERRRFIEQIAKTSPHVTYVYDVVEERRIYDSRDIALMFGYSPVQIAAMGSRRLQHIMEPGYLEQLRARRRQLIDAPEGEMLEHFAKARRGDGSAAWIQIREVVFARNDDGTLRQVLGTVQDVTDTCNAQEALRLQTRAIHASTLGIVITDCRLQDHPIIYVNPAFEALTGYKASEVLGRNSGFLQGNDRAQSVIATMDKAITEGKDCTVVVRNYRKDGTMFWNELHLSPVYDDQNRLTNFIGFQKDITARIDAEEALRKAHEQLEHRVAERTAELAAAYEELKQLDKIKSKFVSDVSHELRHPLTNLTMRVYLLEHDLPANQAEHLAVLKSQVELLNQILEDILQLSRLEVGRNRIQFEPVDLNIVAEQVISTFRLRAEAAGLTLQLSLQADLPLILGVYNYLSQVIGNLVVNAINYTPAGEVWIRTYTDPHFEGVFVQVQDTGIGIDEQDLPHVFERFYRGKAAKDSNLPGTGLGLGIVKEIVDLHGGEIMVESTRNRGTTITIWLPKATQAGVAG